jgi:hypothetical protein
VLAYSVRPDSGAATPIAIAGPGDFLLVPAWLPHREINPSSSEDLHCVLIRSGVEEVVVNLELDAVDSPEWIERPGLASGPQG